MCVCVCVCLCVACIAEIWMMEKRKYLRTKILLICFLRYRMSLKEKIFTVHCQALMIIKLHVVNKGT